MASISGRSGWTNPGVVKLRERSDLDTLVPYSSALASSTPVVVRASSNEAPNGVSPAVRDAVMARLETINRYPQLGLGNLAATIADTVGAGHDEVVVGDGALSVLNFLLLTYCTPGSTVVYPWRSYESYPISVRAAGARPVEVPNLPDGSHDMAAIAAAIDDTTVAVLLCTPNNPTGTTLSHDDVAHFVEQVPDDVLIVLDEAYRDFVVAPDLVRTDELMAAHANVISLRTFSKAWGLAGMRVGYMIAAPEIGLAVRKILPPFSINALAEAAVPAALSDPGYHDAIVEAVIAQRTAVIEILGARGVPHTKTQANFVWLPLGPRSVDLGVACAARGMSTRVFGDDGIRISLGEPGMVPLLVDALDAFEMFPKD